MSQFPALFCAVSPDALSQLQPYPMTPVLLAYRLGPGPKLLRSCGPIQVRGGLLAISQGDAPLTGDAAYFCRQAVQECQTRGAVGVLADWDQFSRSCYQLTRQLGHSLERVGLSLYVPEAYAGVTDKASVLISSALSGGSLEVRLKEALERYGPERTVLALQRMGEDFVLPSPSGRGAPLSPQALAQLRRQRRPSVYWSSELCARYFTYRVNNEVHFVLFDDGICLRKKLELAGRLGIRRAIAAWEEISGCVREVVGTG